MIMYKSQHLARNWQYLLNALSTAGALKKMRNYLSNQLKAGSQSSHCHVEIAHQLDAAGAVSLYA
jgi:hypothetical protein